MTEPDLFEHQRLIARALVYLTCQRRRVARQLTEGEIKAVADRAEAGSVLTSNRLTGDPRSGGSKLAPTPVIEG